MLARILVEITTQESARDWPSYLREDEKTASARSALASCAPRTKSVAASGEPIALLGTGRTVVAFDPDTDSPALVRAVIQLLGVEASRRVATTTGSYIGVADSKILAGRQQLSELVALPSSPPGFGTTLKVVAGLDSMHATLAQTLDQALAALRSATQLAACPTTLALARLGHGRELC